MSTAFVSCSSSSPCPICADRDGRCGLARAGGLAICRAKSRTNQREQHPASGWKPIGKTDDGAERWVVENPTSAAAKPAAPKPEPDLRGVWARARSMMNAKRLAELAADLHLPSSSVAEFEPGWIEDSPALREFDGAGTLVGIARRWIGSDRKHAIGSRGLTMSAAALRFKPERPVYVCEGASDTIAACALGLQAIGRSAATHGAEELSKFLAKFLSVVIIGDNDLAGQRGARAIARSLAKQWGRPVQVALPPEGTKDIRAWAVAQSLPADDRVPWTNAGGELVSMMSFETVGPAEAERLEPVLPSRPTNALPLRILIDRLPGRSLATISARRGDQVLHMAKLDPASATGRQKFAAACAAAEPGLDPELIATELLRGAAAAQEPPAPSQPAELPAGALVRPGLFHVPEVSGLLRYTLAIDSSGPVARPELVLAWADGRRERGPFKAQLPLSDRQALWLHPAPEPLDARVVTHAWSEPSLRGWLGGEAPEPAEVWNRAEQLVRSCLWLPPEEGEGVIATLCAFILLTYFAPIFTTVPYLHLTGPKGSGKTVALDLIEALSFSPLSTANATPASLFRAIHARGGTLVIDEAETLNEKGERSADLRAILLAGYAQGRPATRCQGDEHRVQQFDVFGPKALGSIRPLPASLASRCIRIGMLRRPQDAPALASRPAVALDALRDKLHQTALAFGSELLALAQGYEHPAWLTNRDRDLWGPLLVIARWLEDHGVAGLHARLTAHARAAVAAASQDDAPDEHHELLLALRDRIAEGRGSSSSPKDLLNDVRVDEPERWAAWTPERVGVVLKSYGLHAKKLGDRRSFRDVTVDQIDRAMRAYNMVAAPESLPVPSALSDESEPEPAAAALAEDRRDRMDGTDGMGGGDEGLMHAEDDARELPPF